MSNAEWTADDAVRVAAEEGGLYWISTRSRSTAHMRRAMLAATGAGHLMTWPQDGMLYASLTDAGRAYLSSLPERTVK